MKQSSLILSMVIPGDKGPGNDIDIFLQLLIEKLKQFGRMLMHLMLPTTKYLNYGQLCYGLLMIFQHMPIYLAGVQRDGSHVLVVEIQLALLLVLLTTSTSQHTWLGRT